MSVTFTGEVHPLAARWPMLSDEELASLADSIADEGLEKALVLDAHGCLVDGRNRLAACSIAGVVPRFEVRSDLATDADVRRFVVRANAQRRNVSTGQKAMAVAEQLAADGKRKNGRWRRGEINDHGHLLDGESDLSWAQAMARAGLVLDHTPDLIDAIISGDIALRDAADQAAAIRDAHKFEQERERLRMQQLVELRKRKPTVAALVDKGDLSLEDGIATVERELEAERLAERERAEVIAKFSRDVTFAINCLAPLAHHDQRREEVQTLNFNEIPGAPITHDLIREAIASLTFILETHPEAK